MLSMGSASYAYDGAGNRIKQTVSATVTNYLLDLQPGLATVLQATQGANTTRYVHAPRGIHAQKDALGNWEWMLQDGLGSVRGVVDSSLNPLESRLYEPYGVPFGTSGTSQTSYGFTGEMTDTNNLLYLRARYYAPSLGVFTGLDPMEKTCNRLWINRYSWVDGNVINRTDPTGRCALNNSSTDDQKGQCSQAINDYITNIERVHGSQLNWSLDLRGLVERELRYWNTLPYSEFVNRWNNNSSYIPGREDSSGTTLSSGLAIAGFVSQLDSPLPGPADLVALGIAVCAVGLAALASANAIALPTRQVYYFSDTNDQAIPIPIPNPDDFPNCTEEMPTCEALEVAGGFYQSWDEAKNALGGGLYEKENERQYTDGTALCPEDLGTHSQFYRPGGTYVASVTCCHCCELRYGPFPDVRCFTRKH